MDPSSAENNPQRGAVHLPATVDAWETAGTEISDHLDRGDLNEAAKLVSEFRRIGVKLFPPGTVRWAQTLHLSSSVLVLIGRPREALADQNRVIDFVSEHPGALPLRKFELKMSAGMAQFSLGDLNQAKMLFLDAAAELHIVAQGDRSMQGSASILAAINRLLDGDIASARQLVYLAYQQPGFPELQQDRGVAAILLIAGQLFLGLGDALDAELLLQESLRMHSGTGSFDRANESAARFMLAQAYIRIGKPERALGLLSEARESPLYQSVLENCLGRKMIDLETTLLSIAGRPGDAEKLARQELSLVRGRSSGPDDLQDALTTTARQVLDNLKLIDADSLVTEALALAGSSTTRRITLLSLRAILLETNGNQAEARKVLLEALELSKGLEGAKLDSNAAQCLLALAGFELRAGNAELGRSYLAQAENFIPDPRQAAPPVAAHYYSVSGRFALAEHDLTRAEECFESELRVCTQLLGLGGSSPAALVLVALAEIKQRLGSYDEAEQMLITAKEIFDQSGRGDSMHVLGALSGLADVYEAQGRPAEAEPLRRQAEAIDAEFRFMNEGFIYQRLQDGWE